MKKIKIFIIILISSIVLTSCVVKTPEELIQPPEVDSNKKQIISLVNSFMPANSEILDLGSSSQDISSLEENSEEMVEEKEIIVMYRNKNTREIGIFILAHDGMIWDKKMEKNLESTDVSDYHILDLNNDGKNEIIVGYFEDINKRLMVIGNIDNEYKVLYSEKYLAFNIAQDGKNKLIAISSPFETQSNNRFIVLKYDGESVFEWASKVYDYDVEIYKIEYGNINAKEKAYVLDNYKDVYLGSVDVLKLENRSLISVVPKEELDYLKQEVLTSSEDINNDGIIDISGNEILTNRDSNHGIILNKYYNFTENKEIELLKSIYEDHHANIKIDIKKFPVDKIYIDKSDDKNLKISYVDSNNREWKIVELINIDLNTEEYDNTEYERVLEKNKEVVIAKYEHSNELTGDDKKSYDEIFNIIRKNEEAIKFIE